MTVEMLQDLRFLVIYPLLAVAGGAWALLSWMRYRQTGQASEVWSGLVALGVAIWGMAALLALWIASSAGFSLTTSALTTLGSLVTALALTAAVVVSLVRQWRRPGA